MSEFSEHELLEKLSQRLADLSVADREQRLRNLAQKRPELARLLQVYLAGQADGLARNAPARRHGPGVWLFTGFIVLLLAAVAVAGLYVWRQYEPMLERQAAAERALATEAFLTELVQIAGPYMRQDGRDPLAIFAELGERELAAREGLDAQVRARLALALARVHLARGDGDHALRVLERGRDGVQQPSPSLAAELAYTQAQALAEQGELSAAVATQQAALDALDPALVDAQRLALAQAQLAALLHRNGDIAVAEATFEQAMATLDDGDDLARLRARADYARLLNERGRHDDLRRLQRRLEIADQDGCADCGLVAAERAALQATIAAAIDGPVAAASRFDLAAERLQTVLGSGHPRLAEVLREACSNWLRSGHPEQAEPRCQRAQAIVYTALGPDSALFAQLNLLLAETGYRRGRFDEALAHAERARRQFEQLESTPDRFAARMLLARLQQTVGRPDVAIEHARRAEPLLADPALHAPATRLDWILRMADAELAVAGARLSPADVETLGSRLRQVEALVGDAGSALDVDAMAAIAVLRVRLLPAVSDAEVATDADADADRLTRAREAAITALAVADDAFEAHRLRVDLALSLLASAEREQAVAVLDPVLADWSADAQAAHWGIAWAAARRAGRSGDRSDDAEARTLLQQQRISQPHVQAWLRP